jgi:hypothetical protein
MKSKIAARARARLGQAVVSSNSRLMVAKKDSDQSVVPAPPGAADRQPNAASLRQDGELSAAAWLVLYTGERARQQAVHRARTG